MSWRLIGVYPGGLFCISICGYKLFFFHLRDVICVLLYLIYIDIRDVFSSGFLLFFLLLYFSIYVIHLYSSGTTLFSVYVMHFYLPSFLPFSANVIATYFLAVRMSSIYVILFYPLILIVISIYVIYILFFFIPLSFLFISAYVTPIPSP